jgi:hypothetical protein
LVWSSKLIDTAAVARVHAACVGMLSAHAANYNHECAAEAIDILH